MDVEFADDDLDRWETDRDFGRNDPLVRRYRKVMGAIRAASDERDLYKMKSLRFEKLKGKRRHQRSLRLNDQWRLIVQIVGQHPQKRIRVIAIEDYH